VIAFILPFLLKFATGKTAGAILEHLNRRTDAQTDREKIQAELIAKHVEAQATVIQAGMQHKMFWVAWSIASIPMAVWFGWGLLDSTFNGALPDVAALPPQLKFYADTVWANIFYTGGAVAGATNVAKVIGQAIVDRRK
jgi:hypothetical protein